MKKVNVQFNLTTSAEATHIGIERWIKGVLEENPPCAFGIKADRPITSIQINTIEKK